MVCVCSTYFSLFTGSVNYEKKEQFKSGKVNGVLDPHCAKAYHLCDMLQ